MQGAEDVGVSRRLNVNNAKRQRTRRGAGAHSCVRAVLITPREILGAFILQKGADRGVFMTSFFVLVWGKRQVKAGGSYSKIHQGDAGSGCAGIF